ncbi:MAG TPA: DEAD/DEAH box helicase [Povalibacter sp.]|uniref:DEAD/DEAH box helicase n=1 Tax=Povalibacter sp. TaxID=1962978 RepID=UPI002BFD37DB|nr:DEAD/DEAH box helicase [Povalibacter sp.]HMN45408.1 DEAD/DEAH box helicase [Povalibacter sp.]
MSVLTQFAPYFDGATRRRGDAYADSGRVAVEEIDDRRVRALVRGSELYETMLERRGSRLRAACTCPYAEDAPCKHLWALIVSVRDDPILQPAGDGKRLGLQHIEPWAFDRPMADMSPGRSRKPQKPQPKAAWRTQLKEISDLSRASQSPAMLDWPSARQLLYVIDVASTRASGAIALHVMTRDPRKDGSWGKPKVRAVPAEVVEELLDAPDRRVLTLLGGAQEYFGGYDFYSMPAYGAFRYRPALAARYQMSEGQARELLPVLCATTRCYVRLQPEDDQSSWTLLSWDDGEPWEFVLTVAAPSGDRYEVQGVLRRNTQTMSLSEPAVLLRQGLMITPSTISRYQPAHAFPWMWLLRQKGPVSVPAADAGEFVAALVQSPSLPPIELPPALRYEEIAMEPRPQLRLRPTPRSWEGDKYEGELGFAYADAVIGHADPRGVLLTREQRQLIRRDMQAETAARQRLIDAGLKHRPASGLDAHDTFTFASRRLPAVVSELLSAGWQVEAQGRLYRQAGRIDVRVQSGIDWFELHADVHFGDQVAHLPDLLRAARSGEQFVRLGDGTWGVLPEQWLQRYAGFAGTGKTHQDHVRFGRSQAGLLDALLAQQSQASVDEPFARLRADLKRFGGIASLEPPPGFRGELRPYQRESLGWFAFLRQYGFGGCLADDMGLGKTVQVLALLESRRMQRSHPERVAGRSRKSSRAVAQSVPPSLIVVPRSLVYNWKQEAARFTPQLRMLDHTGSQRQKDRAHFEQWDVVLTTYGTLRRDAADLMNMRFDYAILDESQAIKNAASDSAKAVRLLRADHRLALSGTPIENHLGELWSLFEFLNPGMFGTAALFKDMTTGSTADDDARRLIAHALRPFLLRRTKEQVARDLPARVEQTLYCELDDKQRKRYDELRDHYRKALLSRIAIEGINKSRMQILEMLLRLRQAAIHPGLIDDKLKRESSAKLEMLLPRLAEAVEEGHKVLVFSQFTQMLGILRAELDRMKITYEYLDGRTRDRQACVQRFQSDPDCKLFLISLKAGGVGLNLTAAQYVFLLDPWWNPAVEAQAIDRAHRIGQTQQVFAYRLIARDTVEEKILELQTSKRDLADAIVNADNASIRNLSREDLELLLA